MRRCSYPPFFALSAAPHVGLARFCRSFATAASLVPLHKDGTRRDDRQPVPGVAVSRCCTPAARRRSADATDSRPAARAGSVLRPSAGCVRVWLPPPCPAPAPTTAAPACRDAARRRRGGPWLP